MDELVDEIIEILNDDDLREIFLGYLIQRKFSKIITQDEIYFGIYHVKPEVYEKLEKNDDKKQIILKAISFENKGKRRLAEILFYNNPLAFLSKEEIEKILVPEKIKELGWSTKIVESFIKATGNIEKYLDSETIDEYELESVNIERLIIATGNIEKYLTPDELDRLRLLNSSRARLIEATGNIEKYLTHDLIRAFELRDDPLSTLIEETGNIEKYLIPEIIEYLDVNNLERLIIATGNVDKYLKPEFIKASTFGTLLVKDLIFESKHPEIYLTGELIDQFELDKNTVVELIKKQEI